MSERDECVAGCPFTGDALQRSTPSHLPHMRLLDVTAVERYSYQRLQSWQTRMIKLLPGRPEDPLHCELAIADLIQASKAVGVAAWSRICTYEAISYSWGWPGRDHEIRCSGKSIKVPPSLADALQYLRSSTDSRILWCDALCINQDDADEKASQVRKMFIIFKLATCVIGWLGKEDDHCMMFRHISRMYKMRTPEGLEFAQSLCRPGSHKQHCVERMHKDVSVFLERSLFHRLWIRQEFAAADFLVLQCGSHTLDFPFFVNGIEALVGDPALSKITSSLAVLRRDFDFIRSVHAARRHTGFGDRFLHWLQVLSDGQSFGSSNASDRIYALVSLADPDSPAFDSAINLLRPASDFPINYREAVGRTYSRLASHLLQLDNLNLEALWFFGPRHYDGTRIPSWVVDWRSQTARLFPSLYAKDSKKDEHVGQWLSWSLERATYRLRAETLFIAQGLRKEKGIPRHEVAAIVLNTPHFGDEVGKYLAKQAVAGTYRLFSAAATLSAKRPPKAPKHWTPWQIHSLPEKITATSMPYLSFFAPATTRPTDRIAILGPATFPVVLRPTRDASNYQFIGACSIILAPEPWPEMLVEQDPPVNVLSLADVGDSWGPNFNNFHDYEVFLNFTESRSRRADRPLYYSDQATEVMLV